MEHCKLLLVVTTTDVREVWTLGFAYSRALWLLVRLNISVSAVVPLLGKLVLIELQVGEQLPIAHAEQLPVAHAFLSTVHRHSILIMLHLEISFVNQQKSK